MNALEVVYSYTLTEQPTEYEGRENGDGNNVSHAASPSSGTDTDSDKFSHPPLTNGCDKPEGDKATAEERLETLGGGPGLTPKTEQCTIVNADIPSHRGHLAGRNAPTFSIHHTGDTGSYGWFRLTGHMRINVNWPGFNSSCVPSPLSAEPLTSAAQILRRDEIGSSAISNTEVCRVLAALFFDRYFLQEEALHEESCLVVFQDTPEATLLVDRRSVNNTQEAKKQTKRLHLLSFASATQQKSSGRLKGSADAALLAVGTVL
ncbi:hypothetical protein FBULB1_7602 [Fusarium bulbicola]|nr:hypothetical protein FBULB1_7602 [Fusarium bulbicola]